MRRGVPHSDDHGCAKPLDLTISAGVGRLISRNEDVTEKVARPGLLCSTFFLAIPLSNALPPTLEALDSWQLAPPFSGVVFKVVPIQCTPSRIPRSGRLASFPELLPSCASSSPQESSHAYAPSRR